MVSGTQIGRVRGLGSAHAGARSWMIHRLTALSNLSLTIWLFVSLLALPNFEQATVAGWLGSPWGAIPMLLLLVSVIFHLRLGLQDFIDDYAHDRATKLGLVVLLNFYAVVAFALGVYAIARCAFGGQG